jgi:hypothetical protein
MNDKTIVKTVRFKESEINSIEDFLAENPAIDFSTLIKLAVGKFLTSPTLNKAQDINKDKLSNKKQERLWS